MRLSQCRVPDLGEPGKSALPLRLERHALAETEGGLGASIRLGTVLAIFRNSLLNRSQSGTGF